MEDFVVSARKYRPDTFDAVVGQDSITTTLKNAIRNGHVAQSFLFCGPRGVGKTTCARILARTINCTNLGPDLEPCGQCESCRGFSNNASQNIYELDAASNRSVEAMRTLIEHVRIPPQVGKYKVYIIDEVHMLTPEAFNTFLKTLEEPPAYAKFILATTEKNKIIPTILSRCQIFDFKRISVEDITAHLKNICEKEGIAFEEEGLRVVAQKADGGLRDALSMFDQIVSFSGNSITYKQVVSMLNILDYETYFQMIDFFYQGNVPGCLNLFNRILDNGFDGQVFVDGLSDHLRSLLLMQDKQTVSLMEVSASLQSHYAEQSSKTSIAALLQALELCNTCDQQYRNSNHKRLLVEILLLQLVRLFAPAVLMGKEAPASALGESEGPVNAGPQQQGDALRSPASAVPVSMPQPGSASVAGSPLSRPQEVSVSLPLATDKPVETGRPMDKTSISIPGMNFRSKTSLKAFEAKLQENRQQQELSMSGQEETPFTQDQLESQWKVYMANAEKEKPGLYSVLANANPELKENYTISLRVPNQFVKEDLLSGSQEKDLLDYLRNELKNKAIRFVIHVDESMEPSKAIYTPLEKFQEMQKNNPEIKNFRDALNLDLEL